MGHSYCLIYQFTNALALSRSDRHHGNPEGTAHLLYINRAAVGAHLVHHVQRQYHRDSQFQQLER